MLFLTISAGMESYLTETMFDILPTSGYFITVITTLVRKVWRYQRGNQKPSIEEEHTTPWVNEKGQTTIFNT